MTHEEQHTKDYLRLKIDLPSFQFEIVTQDPHKALPELRKIMETLQLEDQIAYEEFAIDDIKSGLSSAFVDNQQVMAAVKRLLKSENDYRVARTEVNATATIDLDQHIRN